MLMNRSSRQALHVLAQTWCQAGVGVSIADLPPEEALVVLRSRGCVWLVGLRLVFLSLSFEVKASTLLLRDAVQ